MLLGFWICFAIRPELLDISTPLSEFGNDVRTAPYFAGAVFVGAYGMWRWRNYLARTWKRKKPVTGLMTLTVIGLYLIALMPVSWQPWPHRIHTFGVVLAGSSMLATVIIDYLLTRSRRSSKAHTWRLLRLTSFLLILTGGWITFGSVAVVGWYDLALLGEALLIAGYFLWICHRTYQGEGKRSVLSRILKDLVLVD